MQSPAIQTLLLVHSMLQPALYKEWALEPTLKISAVLPTAQLTMSACTTAPSLQQKLPNSTITPGVVFSPQTMRHPSRQVSHHQVLPLLKPPFPGQLPAIQIALLWQVTPYIRA